MGITDIKFLVLQELGRTERPDFVSSDSNDVKIINNQYDFVLSLALENYPWGFATFKTELTEPEELETGKFKYKYELPSDCLFVRQRFVSDNYTSVLYQYEQIGKELYCNSPKCFISYTKKVPEDNMPTYFIDYFKYLLASRVCNLATGDTNLLQILEERKARAFDIAKNADVRQKPVKKFNLSALIDVR